MSKLVALIDAYKDTHGQPSDASVARAVEIAPQTLNSWRKRGIRELPDPEILERVAAFLGYPYRAVLDAAEVDAGYMPADEYVDPEPPQSWGVQRRGVRGA